jgi:hypothetical protein
VSFTLAFALQLRKKHGKTSVRVAEEYVKMFKDVAFNLALKKKSFECSL